MALDADPVATGGLSGGGPFLLEEPGPLFLAFLLTVGDLAEQLAGIGRVCESLQAAPAPFLSARPACRSRITSRLSRTHIYHIYDIFYMQPI